MKSIKVIFFGLIMMAMIPCTVFADLEFLKTANFFCIHTTDEGSQWLAFARDKKNADTLYVYTDLSGENCKEVFGHWEDSEIKYTCNSLQLGKDEPSDIDLATLNCRVHIPGEPWAVYETNMIIKGTDQKGRLRDPYFVIMHNEPTWIDYDKTEILDKKDE